MTIIKGIAAPWMAESKDMGFVEIIEPNAFDLDHDIECLYSHEVDDIVGRVSAGNLKVSNGTAGLEFEVELPDTNLGRDLAELVRKNILQGASVGMVVQSEYWDWESEPARRYIEKAKLFEISIVANPAYPDTFLEVV